MFYFVQKLTYQLDFDDSEMFCNINRANFMIHHTYVFFKIVIKYKPLRVMYHKISAIFDHIHKNLFDRISILAL